MPDSIITYFGQTAKVNCDGNCSKAWGLQNRPTVQLSDNEDDFAFLADCELGVAPDNPGTEEGRDVKPASAAEFPNKWCVRECERCSMSSPGQSHLELEIKSFDERVYTMRTF